MSQMASGSSAPLLQQGSRTPQGSGKEAEAAASEDLGLETLECHFCSILSIRASHRASRDPRGEDGDSLSPWEEWHVPTETGQTVGSHGCRQPTNPPPSPLTFTFLPFFLSHLDTILLLFICIFQKIQAPQGQRSSVVCHHRVTAPVLEPGLAHRRQPTHI